MPEWVVKYWVEWVFGLIIAGLGVAVKHVSSKIKAERAAREALERQAAAETEALKSGMRSLLRRQILQDCEEAQAMGWCDKNKKGTISAMYEAYHGLGGNDVVTAAVRQVIEDLPLTQIH